MKFTSFIIAICATVQLSAQDATPKYNFMDSEKIIKLDLGGLFNRTPMIGLEVESMVDEQMSLQFGAGIIPSFFQPTVGNNSNNNFTEIFGNNMNNNGFDNLRGYRLSAELRFYAFKKPTRYLATGINFRHLIIRDRDVSVGMEPFDNGFGQIEYAYFKNTDMRFHQFRSAIEVKYGFQKNMGTNFVIDFNMGLRLRTTNVQSGSDLPEGGSLASTWNNGFILFDNYKRSGIAAVIGLKIGYRL
ncbi:MAG: hypothetical protein AB8B72_10220 [Crocinitomicaceae bacterium]